MTSTRLRTTKRAGAVALALAAGSTGLIATAGSASATNWDAVAQCESGGNWSTNTGNGFSGGLQFTPSTWAANGGTGSPQNASRAEQIRVAESVKATQGMGAWPVCGSRGGSGTTSNYSTQSSRASRSSERQAVTPKATTSTSSKKSTSTSSKKSTTTSSKQTATRHVSSGAILDTDLVNQVRGDVKREQANLNRYGAHLAVDGQFGPLTEAATKQFQAKHGLSQDGRIGPNTKAALHR